MDSIVDFDIQKAKDMLRKYNKFLIEKDNFNLKYSYDTCSNYLNIILEKYNLKLLTEGLDDFSKIMKMTRWVNRIVPLNRELVLDFENYNALELLEKVSQGYSLNCAGYAIVLNEVLIALGFKSKCIWCLPFDFENTDNECHVINHVYLPREDKYIIVDGAFGCCIKDSQNNFVNVIELRSLLEKEAEIKLLKTTSLYHDSSFTHTYITYLYKNLFMYSFLTTMNFTFKNGKRIYVVPQNYILFLKNDNSNYNLITNNIKLIFS